MDNADTCQALVAGYVSRNFFSPCTARRGAVDFVFVGSVCFAFVFRVFRGESGTREISAEIILAV